MRTGVTSGTKKVSIMHPRLARSTYQTHSLDDSGILGEDRGGTRNEKKELVRSVFQLRIEPRLLCNC